MSESLGKYQKRERRKSGGMIECLIKREGLTPVTLDGFTYIFAPNEHRHNVAYVQSPAHCERLLADSAAFREYVNPNDRKEPAGDLPLAAAEKAAAEAEALAAKEAAEAAAASAEASVAAEAAAAAEALAQEEAAEAAAAEKASKSAKDRLSVEVEAKIIALYFDEEMAAKDIATKLKSEGSDVKRPEISRIISDEKGRRGIVN